MKQRIDDPEFAARMSTLVDLAGNANKLARQAGLSLTTIQSLLTGKSDPTRMSLIALAEATGTEIEWIAAGAGPMRRSGAADSASVVAYKSSIGAPEGDFVFVPMMQGRISAGGGLLPDNTMEMAVAFRRDWIERKGDARLMSVIRVQGDSMAPTLAPGDVILVNHNVNAVAAGGGIYAIALKDEIVVKRVEVVLPSGALRITSDNKEYGEFIADPGQVTINGKVIWYGRDLER